MLAAEGAGGVELQHFFLIHTEKYKDNKKGRGGRKGRERERERELPPPRRDATAREKEQEARERGKDERFQTK